MKIKVIKTHPHDGTLRKISFSTSVGCGIAFWANENLKEGGEYDVELDIDDNLVWGININPTHEEKDKIDFFGNTTRITAGIISNEDRSLAIEFQSSITLIEINPSPPPYPQRVEISAKNIILYPVEF